MDRNKWIIFSVIVVAVIGGMIYVSSSNRLNVDDISKDSSVKILGADERNGQIGDHVFGNKDSKVLLIEYGDFQCNPGCRLFHENFTPIMQDESYKQKIAFVYRNFPITQIHPNATASAATAEAAGLQGKYWEMWDMLFSNQAEWSAASVSERSQLFESYARELGLNQDKFNADYASEAVSKKIKFDKALGMAVGVQGTPTLFVNGKQVEAEKTSSTAAIKDLIDQTLSENK